MSALLLALSELRRLTSGRLSRAALAALVIIPTLYAGFYLYANHDPYGGMKNLPAAVVVEDEGAALAGGERLDAGPRVGNDLVKSGTFEWHRVSRDEAVAGVASDRYAFALVIPRQFSANLASIADMQPQQGTLELVTNDANNYLTHAVADTVVKEVSRSVAEQVSRTAASRMLEGYTTVHSAVGEASKGAGQLREGADKAEKASAELSGGAAKLRDGHAKLKDGATELAGGTRTASGGAGKLRGGSKQLVEGLQELDTKSSELPSKTSQLADGAEKVADGNAKVAAAASVFAKASSDLTTDFTDLNGAYARDLKTLGFDDRQVQLIMGASNRRLAQLKRSNGRIQETSGELTQLADGSRKVATGTRTLAVSATPLHEGIHKAREGAKKLDDGASQLEDGTAKLATGAQALADGEAEAATGAGKLADGSTQMHDGLVQLRDGSIKLHDGLQEGEKLVPNPTVEQRKAMAQTIGNPIDVRHDSQADAGSYGAGLAPFFLNLSLWIGAYVMFLIVRPLSNRALAAGQPAWRVAMGGWIPPMLIGALQAVVVFVVVVVGLGVRAEHPLGVVAMLLLVSMAFVAILQALAARLGAVGKFLGLVLMIVQLVSGGGTFPWQTLPRPLRLVHQVAPMSYGIDAIRRLLYGGSLDALSADIAVVVAYLVVGLAFGTLAARRARVWSPMRIKPELSL